MYKTQVSSLGEQELPQLLPRPHLNLDPVDIKCPLLAWQEGFGSRAQ